LTYCSFVHYIFFYLNNSIRLCSPITPEQETPAVMEGSQRCPCTWWLCLTSRRDTLVWYAWSPSQPDILSNTTIVSYRFEKDGAPSRVCGRGVIGDLHGGAVQGRHALWYCLS
jgi:hypothetical protein